MSLYRSSSIEEHNERPKSGKVAAKPLPNSKKQRPTGNKMMNLLSENVIACIASYFPFELALLTIRCLSKKCHEDFFKERELSIDTIEPNEMFN